MPDVQAPFPHLPIPTSFKGSARSAQGRTRPSLTDTNKLNRTTHSGLLATAALAIVKDFSGRKAASSASPSSNLPPGIPLLLQIDPDADLDFLRSAFGFELVSEDEEGFVIVTSKDFDLNAFVAKIQAFGRAERGSGQTAKVYQLFPDATRLQHILSPELLEIWPTLDDLVDYIVDVSVSFGSDLKFPDPIKREQEESDEHFTQRSESYEKKRDDYYIACEKLQIDRENRLEGVVTDYKGEVLQQTQLDLDDGSVADSFTARVRIKGIGLRDLIVNFQYIFEVTLPDEFDVDPSMSGTPLVEPPPIALVAPEPDAPAVCVIDSGVQEGHRLLTPAVDSEASRCFLPGFSTTDVADYVANGGHGTRVAGAVLFGESIPSSGPFQLDLWLQNARVLDQYCRVPSNLLPSKYIREVVDHFLATEHHTRLYNHSINSRAPYRLRHMSAWGAEIDALSYQRDVLFIQSAGNLPTYSYHPVMLGIGEHIAAGRSYPEYLLMPASRISNPAQSLQAITVGSISYKEDYLLGSGTFARKDGPSSFSKTGYGLWFSIKPDVVEYGGELMHDGGDPMQFFTQPDHCPDLVRSTLGAGGPEKERDTTGTSFSAPKVAHLAAKLQRLLPGEPTLLYRALIAQSARWPLWAEEASDKTDIVRHIGYGLPSEERATSNSPHRVTLVTSGTQRIRAGDAHMYDIPIPVQLREVGEDYEVRIEITLSYAARPRRTRRTHRHCLSTWLDWDTSGRNETSASFKRKIFKEEERADAEKEGTIKWSIGKQRDSNSIKGTSRSYSTLQKDWAVVKPYELPETFSLAVVGHRGWDKDPEAFAKYALAISFEVPGQEITIYEEIRASVQQLVEAQVQAEVELVPA